MCQRPDHDHEDKDDAFGHGQEQGGDTCVSECPYGVERPCQYLLCFTKGFIAVFRLLCQW